MISAREETWRYLSDRFPSLYSFFPSVIVFFRFASSSRQSALPLLDSFNTFRALWPLYRFFPKFFLLFRFHVFYFSGSVYAMVRYIWVETGFPVHYHKYMLHVISR